MKTIDIDLRGVPSLEETRIQDGYYLTDTRHIVGVFDNCLTVKLFSDGSVHAYGRGNTSVRTVHLLARLNFKFE